MKKILTSAFLLMAVVHFITAQVIYTDPVFPRVDEEVTIFFDATKGTGGLADCGCDVYIHTGVITTESTSGSDWKHVNMSWGVANPDWQMTPVPGSPNLYSYTISPNIDQFYGLDPGEEVLDMSFVFRNGDGSIEGKGDGGNDIYYPVYPDDLPFSSILLSPETNSVLAAPGEQINIRFAVSEDAEISVLEDGVELQNTTGDFLDYDLTAAASGTHNVLIEATFNNETISESFSYVSAGAPNIAALPTGADIGINIINEGEVTLVIRAPGKENIFVFGTFTDYLLSDAYQMNRTPDGEYFWINITGLSADENYFYQYLIDGEQIVADPLSTLILDPQNDGSIPAESFPNLPDYPEQMNGRATWLRTGGDGYVWQNDNFERPAQKDLVIYELLVRDFSENQNFITLIDSLDYLERLGVNAIELMPVQEFENNNSWGYNPSFHKALDKYYGSPATFKQFIDECHGRGIAVIIDVVYNHAFGQNPLVQMWFDGKPTADNPYFNTDATHPFNVGFDMNHESDATRQYVKHMIRYWAEEYHLDGYRFDLSKGFTQTNNPDNTGAWSAYDASRIAILEDYADECWTAGGDDFYVILEHLSANDEEKELAAYGNGMMLWGNMNHNYSNAAEGSSGNNIYGVTHLSRNFVAPRLVGYMESHDEQRLMYNCLESGNSSGDYDIQNEITALRRVELASNFFYPIMGPKMLWQFGELGYDIDINYNGRTGEKPVLWEYYDNIFRRRLHNVTASLIHLRRDYPVFGEIGDYPTNSSARKQIRIDGADMDVIVLGNFNITPVTMQAEFFEIGTYYEYWTGETLEVTELSTALDFQPGEYRLYTSVELPEPIGGHFNPITGTERVLNSDFDLQINPNPAKEQAVIYYNLKNAGDVQIEIFDIMGRYLGMPFDDKQTAGAHTFELTNLQSGQYLVRLKVDNGVQAQKLVVE